MIRPKLFFILIVTTSVNALEPPRELGGLTDNPSLTNHLRGNQEQISQDQVQPDSQNQNDINNRDLWGMGGMMGGSGGDTMGGTGGLTQSEMQTIHTLFNGRRNMTRSVKHLIDASGHIIGINSTTTSKVPALARALQTHVFQMKYAEEVQNRTIRRQDPLFLALYRHREDAKLLAFRLAHGIKVMHTGRTPCAWALVQAHANVVSNFVKVGMTEAMQTRHPVPAICNATT